MKKTVEIQVLIDTEQEGVSQIEANHDGSKFRIKILKDQELTDITSHAAIIPLAHELGHVLGKIYAEPEDANDPRSNKVEGYLYDIIPSMENAKAVFVSENRAWEIGEKIMESFLENKKAALKTYEETIGLVKKADKIDPERSEKRRILKSLLEVLKGVEK